MKQEVKLLRKQLNRCYDDGLLISLQESLNFFQQQANRKVESEVIQISTTQETPILGSWASMEKIDVKPQEVEATTRVLEAYCVTMKEHIDKLVARIDHLESCIENAFADYCKIPYYLHAILMHDGRADSGHYYSFIFDRKLGTWWRFSDHEVRMEAEEDVFKEAIGGQPNSQKAAYSLMYIN